MASTWSRFCAKRRAAFAGLGLSYSTVQIVKIKNTKLALIHIVLQLGILAYVALYAIWLKRGYQSSTPVTGSSALKVKGSAYNAGGIPWVTNGTLVPPNYEQVYDSSDLVYPPTERDAVFLTTNFWVRQQPDSQS